MLFDFNFCIIYMYIHSCVHIIFKICYITIIFSYFLLCAVHWMQGFVYEKMLQGNYNYSQDRSFLTENEENPALVLANKAVNREDKPSRQYRDRDIAKFESSRRYRQR